MPPFAIDRHFSESTTTHEMITTDDLCGMVENLVTTMLGMSFQTIATPAEPHDGKQLMAAIRISGQWNATLQIYASDELARRIARAMFGQQDSALGNEDVFDAFGEVVNVIGGNLKGQINLDCTLSLPCVGMAELDSSADGLRITCHVDGAPLTLLLIRL